MEETAKISYRIDAQDHIVFVNDEWSNFALANNGAHLVKESVLHTSLWRFITDLTTEYLYRQILRRVRTGIEMRFTLRCDAPETKRLLEMLITPMAGGEVRFTTVPVWVEGRISQFARSLQVLCPLEIHYPTTFRLLGEMRSSNPDILRSRARFAACNEPVDSFKVNRLRNVFKQWFSGDKFRPREDLTQLVNLNHAFT